MSDRQNARESQPPKPDADSNNEETVKSYYYDDSTGYETYNPEDETEDEEGVGERDPRPTGA
jgi:hypothetical protein